MRKLIDKNKWERKDQFEYFGSFSNPNSTVVTTINVDNIVRYAKSNNLSFYGLMSYMVLKTINSIEEFKYCIDENKVYKYDKIGAAFTVLDKNNVVNFTDVIEYDEFVSFMENFMKFKNDAETGKKFSNNNEANIVYISCLPNIRISSLSEPHDVNKNNSFPTVVWGKYFLENNEYFIDIYLRVHHGLLDGYHMGEFFNKLEMNVLNK